MPEEYNKTLNRPEARHRYWHIYKEDRSFFPKAHETFKLDFHGVIYEIKVNHKEDIMTGQLYEKYQFLEGDRITVKRKKDNTYVLDAPDTKLDPRA